VSAWAGTPRLVRLALRRDRIILPIWTASISLLILAVVSAETGIYRDEAQRAAGAAFGAANIVTRIFDGPASGTSLGAMSVVEGYVVLAIFVALMAGQAVTRHTRLDEETGRAELIGSSVVGRHARLTAALVVAVGASLVVGAAATAALLGFGLPVEGSFAAGASYAGVGIAFAAVAAIGAQLVVTQRGANGFLGLALGVSFLLRAVGDAFGHVAPSGVKLISSWPSWLSPIGWGQQIRPFSEDNWDVTLLPIGFAIACVGIAFWLAARRDLGAGLLRDKLGRATAAPGLLNSFGLAWRLQRGPLIAWTVGMIAVGVPFGAVGDSANDFADAAPEFMATLERMYPGATLVDVFSAFMMGFLGIGAAGYTVQALLRMRAEEASNRLEPVLATAVGRRTWLAGHSLIAAAGTCIVLTAMGLAATLGYWIASGDLRTGLGATGAGLVQIPAALALGAFVLAAFAFAPRWAPTVGWAALAMSLVVGQLGEMLKLPQWALNLSPFSHVPAVPAEPFAILPVAILAAVAVALSGAAAMGFRHRDLVIPA
jgi:ABC-2 type transport system permease protein